MRPIKTRSRFGSGAQPLNLAALTQLVGSLSKRHAVTISIWLRPLVDGRFQVLFHSPVRGASHLSLTVLVHYRSSGRIQPCGMVPADSDRVPRAPPYSGTASVNTNLRVRVCHPLRNDFPDDSTSPASTSSDGPTTPNGPQAARFGLIPFRSPLLGESIFLSSPAGTEMFQFPALAPWITTVSGLLPDGLPHSDTRGSFRACRSPRTFAACRVLHRRRKPRHPPSALLSFPPVNR